MTSLKAPAASPPHDFQADIDAVANIAAVSKILDVVCRTTGMGFAAVARVTADRWITCAARDDIAFGLLPGSELGVGTTICDEIRDSGIGVVIDHVAADPNFCQHHTPLQYGFQSYISMPIVLPGGEFFGTLCAIDPKPARLNNPEIIGMFQLFADLIGMHLAMERRVAASAARLLDEIETADLRDQFIAVLSHDLRNSVAAIEAGTRMLDKAELPPRGRSIVALMAGSAARMQGLIENVLDFARGRLGGGILIDRQPTALRPLLLHVVDEIRAVHADRQFETAIAFDGEVDVDRGRIGQVLSNLLANAVTHGAPTGPIRIAAGRYDGGIEISVANAGAPIPPALLDRIFKPFVREKNSPGLAGLGLGLYIAAQIAAAHGGTLAVTSLAEETRFTLRIPTPPRPSIPALRVV